VKGKRAAKSRIQKGGALKRPEGRQAQNTGHRQAAKRDLKGMDVVENGRHLEQRLYRNFRGEGEKKGRP